MSRLRTNYLTEPLRDRLSESHLARGEIMRRHELAVKSGIPNYPDPHSGLSVMTAATLAAQNVCCANGCRHCPFEPE
ncbi:MAG: DUF5522 domain-containing protein [Ilumatobacteraceae bacterium]